MKNFLTTKEVAQRVGVHPNTIRWYESEGFIPPVPRTSSGYRMFNEIFVLHAGIAYLGLRVTWMTGPVRDYSINLLKNASEYDYVSATENALLLAEKLEEEKDRTEKAIEIIENWRSGGSKPHYPVCRSIKEASVIAAITPDQIRNWEKNGLFRLRRNTISGYREFNSMDIDILKVIRVLRNGGFSLMAIRRFLSSLRRKEDTDLRSVIDTPEPHELEFSPILYPTDSWLTTLEKAIDAVNNIIIKLEKLKNS